MRYNWINWLAVSLIFLCSNAPRWAPAQSSLPFALVNSSYDEQFPLISPDGQTLYFVRDRHPNNMGFEDLPDIWQSHAKIDGAWGPPIHLGMPINNLKANRLAGMSIDGQTLYLFEDDGLQGWISITHQQGRRWTSPQSMIIERFVPGASASFSVSADEQYLLIASEQSDGQGNTDLYVSFRQEERKWSHPLSLGTTVNTPGRESWAMIAADGQTLYFASDGHLNGAGGLDLWMSRRQDDSWQNWSPPLNLGTSINSAQDEMGMAITGTGDAIVLDRLREQKHDLEQVALAPAMQPFAVTILSGRLLDINSRQLPARKVEAFYQFLHLEKAEARPLKLQGDGAYKIIVPSNWGAALYANLPGYLPLSERFDLTPQSRQLDTPNPQIALWAGANSSYWQEEAIIHSIQNHLQLILEEIEVQDQKRKDHRRVLAEKTYDVLENEDILLSDPEIEALERRFNIYQRHTLDSLSITTSYFSGQPLGTSGGEALKDFSGEPADEEAIKLRQEFRSQRPQSTVLPATKMVDHDSPESTGALISFQELKRRAEKELTYEMLPRVQAELVQETFPIAWRSLQTTTSAAVLKNLTEEEDSIRIQIRLGLGQFILAPDAFEANSEEEYEWWRQLKADLKNILRQDVRSHLKTSLRPLVLTACELELDYQLKRLMAISQRQALNMKIEQQQKIEIAGAEALTTTDHPPFSSDLDTGPEPGPTSFGRVQMDLLLAPIEKNHILELKNVRFSADGLDLLTTAYAELDRIVQFLRENPEIAIQIRTHTHGWCDHAKALNLTEGRARLLADYFTERGIRSDRIKYVGLGKTQPRTDNNVLPGRAANQRTEIKILRVPSPK